MSDPSVTSEARDTLTGGGDAIARLRMLFDLALDIPAADRAAWILRNVAEPGDRETLARLLAAADEIGGGFLDTPVSEHASALAADSVLAESLVGQRIGVFRLVRLLGKGGMAAVFLGSRESGDFRQDVAIKLLRRGLYSEIEQRLFQRERRVLASLNHPNIARLIDGGLTDAGVPYLVMEYVDGESITRHANARALDLRTRLTLFLTVCRAVEAAHRALIVHRDIKPSNILVATDGTVKLLDFGIAKLLEENAQGATIGVFTPDYAAPEQIAGKVVTTATDVYALGVLLHELLLGTRPGRTPRRPSALADANSDAPLQRRLRGDLDNILLKALEPEPDRRYASAGALADDIERHLAGLPVAAHPPSRWYRTRKFVARHKGGVLTTAAFLLAIVAALGLALWQARIARQEAIRANVVRDFVISIFKSAGADLPKDKRPSADDLVEQAARRLIDDSDLPAATRVDLLIALARVSISVGAHDRAISLLDAATPLVGADDARVLDIKVARAQALDGKSEPAEIIAVLDPLRRELLARRDETGYAGIVVLGDALVHASSDRTDDGLAMLREARTLAEQDAARLPDAALGVLIGETHELIDARRFREGLERADATVALWRKQGAAINADIAWLYGDIAKAAEATGDIPRAEAAYKQAIALDDRFFDKSNPHLAWDTGVYGTFLVAQGRYAEAEPYVKKGLELRKTLYGTDNPSTLYAYSGMGKLYTGEGRLDDAAHWYGEGIDICKRVALRHNVCSQLLSLRALVEGRQKHFADADRDLDAALELQKTISGEASPAYAYVLKVRVTVEVNEGKYDAAIASADRVLEIGKSVKGGMVQSDLDTRYWRARALFGLGRHDDAVAEMLEVEPKYAELFPAGSARFGMLAIKARALDAAGRHDEAKTAATAAFVLQPNGTPLTEPGELADLRRIAGRD
jgi:tetratricopeptide (TPR) repeat protein/tRNA A-37 threonylcarbamoyl transferase component Bud32